MRNAWHGAVAAVFIMFIAQCGGGGGGGTTTDDSSKDSTSSFNAGAYSGSWSGQWNNNTYGTSGAASAVFVDNEASQTMVITLDLDGNVFGGSDPDPITLTASYDGSMTISETSSFLGDLSVTIDENGNVSGSATNVPSPGISSVDFNGVATQDTITINYTINFTGGGTAQGVLTLNKQ